MLQWVDPPDAALAEMRRVLRPGGLLLASSFGPETLQELRAAWAAVDDGVHVNRFVDVHDLGGALQRAGFIEPVLDVDRHVHHYADVRALMGELKSIGAHNVNAGRSRALTGKSRLREAAGGLRTSACARRAARYLAGGVCSGLGAGTRVGRGRGGQRHPRRDAHRHRCHARQPGPPPMTLHPILRQSLFVAGTDTGVGKTWVAIRLLQALAAIRVARRRHEAGGRRRGRCTPAGLRNDDALALAAAGNVAHPL